MSSTEETPPKSVKEMTPAEYATAKAKAIGDEARRQRKASDADDLKRAATRQGKMASTP